MAKVFNGVQIQSVLQSGLQSVLQSVLYKNAEFAILKQSGKCGAVISKWLQVGCKLWQKFSVALTPSGDASGIGLTLRENCVNTQKFKVGRAKKVK